MKFNGQVVEPYGYTQNLVSRKEPFTGLYNTEILVIGPMPDELLSVVTEAEYKMLENMVCEACDFRMVGDNEYKYRLVCQSQLPLIG